MNKIFYTIFSCFIYISFSILAYYISTDIASVATMLIVEKYLILSSGTIVCAGAINIYLLHVKSK